MLNIRHRIRKKHEYDAIFKNSKRFHTKHLIFLVQKVSKEELAEINSLGKHVYAKFGVIVSKKVDKRAVARNRLKRQIRESVREMLSFIENTPIKVAIIAKTHATEATFEELRNEVKEILLGKLGNK